MTMELTMITLAMLLSLSPAYVDREETGRQERMELIADAISQATDRATCSGYPEGECKVIWHDEPRELAALLVTKGWWESRFVKNVHEGKCKKDECDPRMWNGVLIHSAKSPWQFQKTGYSADLWKFVKGADIASTRTAAYIAARIMSEGKRRCGSPRGAIAFYGIQRCQWSGARDRYGTYVKLMKVEAK